MSAESQLILDKYFSLPERLRKEAGDFIDFLITQYRPKVKAKREEIPGEDDKKSKKRKSNFGSARGLIVINKDFDEPLEDFKEYME